MDIKIGDRFGNLVVLNVQKSKITVQCSCGSELHIIKRWDLLRPDKKIITGCNNCSSRRRPQKVGKITKAFFGNIKKSAKYRNLEFNLTMEYLSEIYESQQEKCILSGLSISFGSNSRDNENKTASVDRIDSKRGYIIGNVQFVHKKVNFMKSDLDQNEFIEICKMISSKE